jgi:hypothetical protein
MRATKLRFQLPSEPGRQIIGAKLIRGAAGSALAEATTNTLCCKRPSRRRSAFGFRLKQDNKPRRVRRRAEGPPSHSQGKSMSRRSQVSTVIAGLIASTGAAGWTALAESAVIDATAPLNRHSPRSSRRTPTSA